MTTTTPTTVLISGGSVAGPALGFWLSRHGFRPTVVELADGIRGGGYPIDLRGRAVDVADRMGLLPQIRAARTHTRTVSFVDPTGRPIVSLKAEDVAGSAAGQDVELPRGDLTSVLYEHTREDVEYVFGDSITGIEQHTDGVRVAFRRGEPRTFDLVVGADGLHSNVRGLTFGPEAPFRRYLGYYFASFPVPNHLGLHREVLLHNTPGRLVGIYAVRDRPQVEAVFAFASSEQLTYDHHDVDQQRRLVEDAFTDAGWEASRMLGSMRDTSDLYFDSISQIRMPAWTSGRVALLGDAGYAPSLLSGQGTSLALVGAYVLAGELAAARGDHRIAFPAYERSLRGFVERNQKLALNGGRALIPANRTQLWIRDQALRVIPLIKRANLVGRGVQRAATSLSLRQY